MNDWCQICVAGLPFSPEELTLSLRSHLAIVVLLYSANLAQILQLKEAEWHSSQDCGLWNWLPWAQSQLHDLLIGWTRISYSSLCLSFLTCKIRLLWRLNKLTYIECCSPWNTVSYFSSLYLSFFACKIGIVIVSPV